MSFAAPSALWLLLLLPLVAGLYVVGQRRRKRYAVRFTNLALLADVATEIPRRRRHVPAALFGLGILALLLALARPEADRQVPREEGGVVLAVDRSGSMLATDVLPTRLEAARRAALEFIDDSPDHFEIGLVTFATHAEVVAPLTVDRDLVSFGVRSIDAGDGTSMGDALARSLDLIRSREEEAEPEREEGTARPPYAVVLLSDGANTTGIADPVEMAHAAAELGVPVHTIALGTDDAVVQLEGPFGFRSIPVPPDRITLQQISDITEGGYFEAPTGDDLQAIYEELGTRVSHETRRQDVTVPVVAGAALLLLLGGGASLVWFGRLP